jgi:hypothetical protein
MVVRCCADKLRDDRANSEMCGGKYLPGGILHVISSMVFEIESALHFVAN